MAQLKWEKIENGFTLKDHDKVILTLELKKQGLGVFFLEDDEYRITRKGLYGPVITVTRRMEKVLTVSYNFWGSNGRIVFEDGEAFVSEYTNDAGVRMTILKDRQQVVSYSSATGNGPPALGFKADGSGVSNQKFYILLALGLFTFLPLFLEMGDPGNMIAG